MCWYCHWGIPFENAKIYLDAVDKLNGDYSVLHYGPSHVVWDDYNFDVDNILRCIDNCDKKLYCDDYTDSEVRVIKWSLLKLLTIPDRLRDFAPDPEDYDVPPQSLTIDVDKIVTAWNEAGRWV